MEALHAYIFSVTAAAMLCSIVTALVGKGSRLTALIKLMTGLVMAAVVIRPAAEGTTLNLNRYLDTLSADAEAAVEAGTSYSREKTRQRITEQLRAYILDKAEAVSVDIQIELTLDEETMQPTAAVLEGQVSPYARAALEAILGNDLGIPAEGLTWK